MKQFIPTHLAFIMDGNRRWAREHKLEMIMGHKKGADRIEAIVEHGAKKGIKVMTFWVFSTENWKRKKGEVDMLLKVFRDMFQGQMVKRMIAKGVKLQIIGEYRAFPQDIVNGLEKLMKASESNTRVAVNIALNYGGRQEILRVVNEIVKADRKEFIDEEKFSSYLFTTGQPDPDMIIRTGGEQRTSGFLPWQAVYSELYFTKTFWPDFDEKELDKALEEYAVRERRFGK
jgi:undecaprenyl diphosphate synthase